MITFSALTFFTDLRFKEHVFTDHEGSQYVLNIPSNCIIFYRSVYYHKLFKANFHCQSHFSHFCVHVFSAIQLPASQGMESLSLKFSILDHFWCPLQPEHGEGESATVHSLITRAPSMRGTFPAIALSFIVLSVLSQIVQGYFPLSVPLQSLLCSRIQCHSASRASLLVYAC